MESYSVNPLVKHTPKFFQNSREFSLENMSKQENKGRGLQYWVVEEQELERYRGVGGGEGKNEGPGWGRGA